MKISIIVAAAENNAIGKDNKLVWHLPNDMKFFKNTTWGMPVIMGRNTFEALNNKPLTGRFNIVLTRQGELAFAPEQHVLTAHSLDEALQQAATTDCKEAFVIGGAKIYEAFLPRTDTIYITRVHASLEGDTFFPDIDPATWKRVQATRFEPDEKHAYAYTFETWDRI